MLVTMKCPNCGADLDANASKDAMLCQFCGTKIMNVADRVEIDHNHSGTVIHKFDHTGEATLNIHYSSIRSDVTMVVRVVETGMMYNFINGQSMPFYLSAGSHQLVLKIGKKNYARTVYIPTEYAPVNIYASWNGRAHITIDQPPVQAGFNRQTPQFGAEQQTSYYNGASLIPVKKRNSTLGILGFIFALTMIGFIPGLILSLVDLIKGDKNHSHGLAIAGLVISSVVTLSMIYSLVQGKL